MMLQGVRASGILLHPTSLPGAGGIGEIGAEGRAFVDFLADAGQSLWQMLPIGPASDLENSPYASFSAMAGNPMLLSLESIREQGLLRTEDLRVWRDFTSDRVDYGAVRRLKWPLLRRAFRAFALGPASLRDEFARRNAEWLDDYALYMALRESRNGAGWASWPRGLADRDPVALAAARRELEEEIRFYQYLQFEFFRQWRALRRHANERGVCLIGDVPIYVAYESADVWAHPDLFALDPGNKAMAWQSGAPPDEYFTSEGQVWSSPVYDWQAVERTGYDWWISRFRIALECFDYVRLDHFRGFEAFWVIPANEFDAKRGHWRQGPGDRFFAVLNEALGQLPIVVEDLGLITPEVHALRERLGVPGMFVLQFAFHTGPANPYLPHKCSPRTVMYTGTHDTNTTRGWFESLDATRRDAVVQYLGPPSPEGIHWQLIRVALGSVARWAIFPLQDALGAGSDARMNAPATFGPHNWTWRAQAGELTEALAARLRMLASTYGRCSEVR
jgi:4-alpha-glucanotransferase